MTEKTKATATRRRQRMYIVSGMLNNKANEAMKKKDERAAVR